jgi:hypothetical protein
MTQGITLRIEDGGSRIEKKLEDRGWRIDPPSSILHPPFLILAP